MNSESAGRSRFPFYLKPGPNAGALEWLGERLHEIRGRKPPALIAKAANVPVSQIQALEAGEFHVSLGQLREIIRLGYRENFINLLAECYKVKRQLFDPKQGRPFERDFHYSVSTRRDASGTLPPSLLIGGDPERFLWAVPMRRLTGQPMETELLEIAPHRKRKYGGQPPESTHHGAELIYVIHGTILAHVSGKGESVNARTLKAGDYIHFLANCPHRVENMEKSTSAFLLVVRVPNLSKNNHV